MIKSNTQTPFTNPNIKASKHVWVCITVSEYWILSFVYELVNRYISLYNWRTIRLLRTLLDADGYALLNLVTQWHLPSSFKSPSRVSHLDIVGLWNRLVSETWQSWEIIPVLTGMNGVISRMSGNSDVKNLNLRTCDVTTEQVCLQRPNVRQWLIIVRASFTKGLPASWLTQFTSH